MMSFLAWTFTVGIIAFAVLVIGLLYLRYRVVQYVIKSKRAAASRHEDLKRIERRLQTERHFRLDCRNNILFYDTVSDQFSYTPEFEEWALANLHHPLDIEDFTGLTFLFLADENEAFSFKMQWG